MKIWKTDKEVLTPKDILGYIVEYEKKVIPSYNKLWDYYTGKNTKISSRKAPDPNNPDNIIPIPYGRKIVTTFTGYAYRPKYITYKPTEAEWEANMSENSTPKDIVDSGEGWKGNYKFYAELMHNFKINDEHIKSSRAGRNTAIFGVSYELFYLDGKPTTNDKLPIKAEVKFFSVDPREIILLYDTSSEPKKKVAIRFYQVSDELYKVEVYYKEKIELYDMKVNSSMQEANTPAFQSSSYSESYASDEKYMIKRIGTEINYFGEIPVVAFYMGDEMTGLINPVIPLIDAYDTLISDSMNEFDRFAHAYLIMKQFGITDPTKKKEPGAVSRALQMLKRYRLFEYLGKDADIKFLTKDIPTGFIDYMSAFIQKQIHIQSHVPDFAVEKFSGASGIAIQRLLFDFENVVSSAEADFDIALYERIRLISIIYEKLGRASGTPEDIVISHKRNTPLNLMEFAQTASIMKGAGFSSYLIADIMPDDIVPNIEEELRRQKEEREAIMPEGSDYNIEENEEEKEPEDENEYMMKDDEGVLIDMRSSRRGKIDESNERRRKQAGGY